MKRKIIGISLFLIGLSIFIYPTISKIYYDQLSRQEIAIIHEEFNNVEASNQLYAEQLTYNRNAISDLNEIEIADVTFSDHNPENEPDFTDDNVLGTMSIPAIDLNYPIYNGASDENLYNGLARVDGTSYPVGGINTNAVIAGHNGLAGKIYFSDIDQLIHGDIIQIQNRQEKLTYEVYGTAIINPDEVSALAIIPGQDTLTLLTCIFLPEGIDRYLVYARRIETPDENQPVEVHQEAKTATTNIEKSSVASYLQLFGRRYGIVLYILVVAVLIMYWIFIRDTKG